MTAGCVVPALAAGLRSLRSIRPAADGLVACDAPLSDGHLDQTPVQHLVPDSYLHGRHEETPCEIKVPPSLAETQIFRI